MAPNHKVVSHSEWIEERKKLLAKEKEFNRLRDELSAQTARAAVGARSISSTRSKDRTAKKLCRSSSTARASSSSITSCSIRTGTRDARIARSGPTTSIASSIHLKHRDISFVAISRAPYAKLAAYHKRMGWSFKWLSSFGSDFNYDYFVVVHTR